MPNAHEPPRIYPTFRYRDPAAMIAWLCDTVGFTVHARHPAEGPVPMPSWPTGRP